MSNNQYKEEQGRMGQPTLKASGRWNVINLKKSPSFGSGTTAMTLVVGKQPTDVAMKVDEFLRLSSIEVLFENNNANAICRTIDHIQFRISLFSDPNSERNTYVEFNKTKGCSFSFTKYKNNLIDAVTGSSSGGNINKHFRTKRTKRSDEGRHPRSKRPRQFKVLPNDVASYTPPTRNELENILMRAGDILQACDSAAVLFTLQNLASMTSRKTNCSAATVHILSDLIIDNKHQVWDKVVMIYTQQFNNLKNEEICVQITNACLRIASNILLSNSARSKDRNNSLNNRSILIEHFIPLLIDTVAQYENTYNACLALKCIAILVDNSSPARRIMKEADNLGFVMEQAREYGCRENLMLQQTAASTIQTFRNHLIM